MVLNNKDLEKIQKRLNNITPGPWKVHNEKLKLNEKGMEKEVGGDLYENFIITSYEDGQLKSPINIVNLSYTPYFEGSPHLRIRENDAEFIAAAPTDIKNLLETINALKQEVRSLENNNIIINEENDIPIDWG